MTNLLVVFILSNVINVIIQTIKSLCTINCGKTVASLVNALAYGFYTYIVILMVCELPTWEKALIIGLCNLVGVYVVKLIEEKMRKDKLWKVEMTAKIEDVKKIENTILDLDLSYNYIPIGNDYTLFNIYCPTQKESHLVKDIVKRYDVKYFVNESKSL